MRPYRLNRELRVMVANQIYCELSKVREVERKIAMERYIAETPQTVLHMFKKHPSLLKSIDGGGWYIRYAELPVLPVIPTHYEGNSEVHTETYKKLLSCARNTDVAERFPELVKYLP